MNDMALSALLPTCHNGGGDGCDCKNGCDCTNGGDQEALRAELSDEQFEILRRATGMHMSLSGAPYRNSLRCAAASGQYVRALELCELGLMVRLGDASDGQADGVKALATFEVTTAGARLLGVGSARELTRDAE